MLTYGKVKNLQSTFLATAFKWFLQTIAWKSSKS